MTPVARIMAIGWLPECEDRRKLISGLALAAKDHHRYYALLEEKSQLADAPTIYDVVNLEFEESAAFLRGIFAVYGQHLRESRDCVCNMPPAVVLPVIVYASLLKRNPRFARLQWDAFAAIPRSCAERLIGGSYPDLKDLTFEDFAKAMLREKYNPDADLDPIQAALLARRMEEAYGIRRP
jgi:hypothetical protein